MPTYFGSKILRRTLDSLVCQTVRDFKLYMSDDSGTQSEDETERLKTIMKEYSLFFEIELFTNSKNVGYPQNLMNLVERSDGEFIFLLAQDDILSPVAIESCMKALADFPSARAVSRPYFWFNDSLNSPIRQIPNLGTLLPELVTTDSDWWKIERTLVDVSTKWDTRTICEFDFPSPHISFSRCFEGWRRRLLALPHGGRKH